MPISWKRTVSPNGPNSSACKLNLHAESRKSPFGEHWSAVREDYWPPTKRGGSPPGGGARAGAVARMGLPPRIRRVLPAARQNGRVARGKTGRSHSGLRVDCVPGNNCSGGRSVQATVANEPDPLLPAENATERCGRLSTVHFPVPPPTARLRRRRRSVRLGLGRRIHEMGPCDWATEEMNLLRR